MKKVKYFMMGCMCMMLAGKPNFTLNAAPIVTKDKTFFQDVKQSEWYAEAVYYVSDQGVVKGISESEFGPHDSMTRGIFILSLYRLANEPQVSHQLVFEDVSQEAEYAAAVEWGVANKIISGYNQAHFQPEQFITREQMVTILYNYTQYIGLETPVEGMGIREYTDEQNISSWARDPMRWGIGAGNIISGVGEQKLNPQGVATRAEAATLLMRYSKEVLNGKGHSVDIEKGNQQYTLAVDFPSYIAPYVELDLMNQSIGKDQSYSLILFKFNKSNQIANIGSLSIYTEKQYDAVKTEGGPVPTELFRQDGLVITFMGLHDMPFELGTPEAELVGKYHQEVGSILKTITLVPLPK